MTILAPLLVSVKVTAGLQFSGDIIEDLLVGRNDIERQVNINEHMDQVSSRMVFWGSMWAEADRQCKIAQIMYDVEKEKHDFWFIRMKVKAEQNKEMKSEKAKEEKAKMDNIEEYQSQIKALTDIRLTIVDKEHDSELIDIIRKAFKAKQDMMISLATNIREEADPEIMVRKWNQRVEKLRGLIQEKHDITKDAPKDGTKTY